MAMTEPKVPATIDDEKEVMTFRLLDGSEHKIYLKELMGFNQEPNDQALLLWANFRATRSLEDCVRKQTAAMTSLSQGVSELARVLANVPQGPIDPAKLVESAIPAVMQMVEQLTKVAPSGTEVAVQREVKSRNQ
jgi:hypothetical protein